MDENNNTLKYAVLAVIVVLFLLIFFIFFQTTGIRFVIGFLLMPLPFFLIINRFNLDFDEKVIFSIFISIISFPLLVWYINYFLIPSLRITILAIFLILLGLGIIIRKTKKENI